MLFKVIGLEKNHPRESEIENRLEKSTWRGGKKPGDVSQKKSEEIETHMYVHACIPVGVYV